MMPICRYFQQGRCRFGENCWYEHPGNPVSAEYRSTHWVSPSYAVPKNQFSSQLPLQRSSKQNSVFFQDNSQSRYSKRDLELYENYENSNYLNCDSYHNEKPRGQSNTKTISSQFNSSSSDKSGNKVDKKISVKDDVISWENEHIWPFSSYGHFARRDACFPGFADISPEELRYKAYEAEQKNCFPSYEAAVATVFQDIKGKWNALKQSSLTYIESIRPQFNLDLSLCSDSVKDLICYSEKGFCDSACDTMQTEGQFFTRQGTGKSGLFKLSHLTSINPATNSAASAFRFVLPTDEDMKVESPASGTLTEIGSNPSFKPMSSSSVLFSRMSSSSLPEVKAFGKTKTINSNYTPLECLNEQEQLQFCSQTFTLGEIPSKPPPVEWCF